MSVSHYLWLCGMSQNLVSESCSLKLNVITSSFMAGLKAKGIIKCYKFSVLVRGREQVLLRHPCLFSGEEKSGEGGNFWVWVWGDFHTVIEAVHWSGKKVREPELNYSVNHCDWGNLEDKNFPLPHLCHFLSQKYRLLVFRPKSLSRHAKLRWSGFNMLLQGKFKFWLVFITN